MTLGKMDRRSAAMLGIGVAAILVLRFGVYREKQADVVTVGDSIPAAEARLARLRQIAAVVPAKEAELKRAQQDLAAHEKGMPAADTAAQAEAQLIETVHRIAKAEGIDARGAEELKVKPLANDYGEVSVTVSFTCGIDQFVNFMAALANDPQLVASNEIHVATGDAKRKTVQVRLSVSGVVPRKLVPEKKGLATF